MAKAKPPTHSRKEILWQKAEAIRLNAGYSTAHVRTVGQLLCEAKELVEHGNWEPWLRHEFGWSKSTAERYMRIHHAFKNVTVTDLKVDLSALYVASQKSTPRPVQEEVIRRASSGEHVTRRTVQKLVRLQKSAVQRDAETIESDRFGQLHNIADMLAGFVREMRHCEWWNEEQVGREEYQAWLIEDLAHSERREQFFKDWALIKSKMDWVEREVQRYGNIRSIKAASGR
jgi:hypothetical protein